MASPTADLADTYDVTTERPSRVRFGVLAFLCTLCLILYLDRLCWGVAKVPLQDELGLKNTDLGWIEFGFMVSYAVFEMPVGRWGDRYGGRGVLTRIVLCWSFFTALTGGMWGFWGLLVVRFLFGAGEAGAFPNAARVVVRWFPGESRSVAQSLVTASAQLGGAIAPIVAAYLCKFFGWRWAFVVFGAVGVVWAVAFFVWFRDDPAQHRGVNPAELDLLTNCGPGAGHEHHPRIPWGAILTNPNVWLLGLAMNCGAASFYMCVYWFPKYLEAARGVELIGSGWLSSLLNVGGGIGCLVGGYLGNWLLARIADRRLVRRMLGCGGFAAAALSIFAMIHTDSPIAASVFTGMALMCGQIQLTSWWAVTSEISGRHQAALFGLMNSMGGVGGGLSPLFFGWFGDWMAGRGYSGREQWDPAFYVYVGIYVIGSVGWMFVDSTKSIEREHGDAGHE